MGGLKNGNRPHPKSFPWRGRTCAPSLAFVKNKALCFTKTCSDRTGSSLQGGVRGVEKESLTTNVDIEGVRRQKPIPTFREEGRSVGQKGI